MTSPTGTDVFHHVHFAAIQVESALLGACLTSTNAVDAVVGAVAADHFHEPPNQQLWLWALGPRITAWRAQDIRALIKRDTVGREP